MSASDNPAATSAAATAADAASERMALCAATLAINEQMSSVAVHFSIFQCMVNDFWSPSEQDALPKGELDMLNTMNALALQWHNNVRALCQRQLVMLDETLVRFDEETADSTTQDIAYNETLLRTTPHPELSFLAALADVAVFKLLQNAARGLQTIDGVHKALLESTEAGFVNSAARLGIVTRLFPEAIDQALLLRAFHVAAKIGSAEVMRAIADDDRFLFSTHVFSPHRMQYKDVRNMAEDALQKGHAAVLALLFRYDSFVAFELFSSHCENAESLKVLLNVQYQQHAEPGLVKQYHTQELLDRILHRATPLRYIQDACSVYAQMPRLSVAAAQELACILAGDVGIRGTMNVDKIHGTVFWYTKEDALAGAVEHLIAIPSFANNAALVYGLRRSLKDAVLEGRPKMTRVLMRDTRITRALLDNAETALTPLFLPTAFDLRLRQARDKAAFHAEQRSSLDCALADPLISTAYDAFVYGVLETKRSARDAAQKNLEAFQAKKSMMDVKANPAVATNSTKSTVGQRRASRLHPPTDDEVASNAAEQARDAEEAGLRLDASSAEKAYAVVQCEYDLRIRETAVPVPVAVPLPLAGLKRQRA